MPPSKPIPTPPAEPAVPSLDGASSDAAADHRAAKGLRRSLPAAIASLALHAVAVVLLAWWIDDRPSLPVPDPDIVVVSLQSVERTDPVPDSEPAPTPPPEPLEQDSPSAAPEENPPDRVAAATEDARPAETPEAPIEARETGIDPPSVGLQELRQQITTLALPDDEDADDGAAPAFDAAPPSTVPWTSSGAPIRGLPLGGGWLNPWVGPVQAYSETWGSVVGEQRGVHVLPNGQVLCTRVDAPTNDELMNPWMSMRVTFVRLCGRERGTPPPTDDLRYAPPPPALRRTLD
ncbi:hypothetical protein [Halomonas denitrificans]|nr:hypothetical protein [Halomonas denitrificans]